MEMYFIVGLFVVTMALAYMNYVVYARCKDLWQFCQDTNNKLDNLQAELRWLDNRMINTTNHIRTMLQDEVNSLQIDVTTIEDDVESLIVLSPLARKFELKKQLKNHQFDSNSIKLELKMVNDALKELT
jgi:hypothetical protein